MSSSIDRVLDDCVRYWNDTGVAESAIADMRSELESHLHEAASAGKTMASVVGDDLEVFAEAWAAVNRPADYRAHPVALAPKPVPVKRTTGSAGKSFGVLALAVAAAVALLAAFGPKEANVEDMQQWQLVWVAGAVLLGIGEMVTAGFFLLPFAVGAAAAAVLALFEVAVPVQLAAFLVVSIAALWLMNKYARKDDENTLPVGANWYIGAEAFVLEDIDPVTGQGRVRVETEQWRATTDGSVAIPTGTKVKVMSVRGARLVVTTDLTYEV